MKHRAIFRRPASGGWSGWMVGDHVTDEVVVTVILRNYYLDSWDVFIEGPGLPEWTELSSPVVFTSHVALVEYLSGLDHAK